MLTQYMFGNSRRTAFDIGSLKAQEPQPHQQLAYYSLHLALTITAIILVYLCCCEEGYDYDGLKLQPTPIQHTTTLALWYPCIYMHIYAANYTFIELYIALYYTVFYMVEENRGYSGELNDSFMNYILQTDDKIY